MILRVPCSLLRVDGNNANDTSLAAATFGSLRETRILGVKTALLATL